MDILIPLFAILLGVVALALYVLTVALRDALRRLADMNERLMIIVGTKDGNEATGRALVASAKLPKKEVPGMVEKKKPEKPEPEKGLKMKVGYR